MERLYVYRVGELICFAMMVWLTLGDWLGRQFGFEAGGDPTSASVGLLFAAFGVLLMFRKDIAELQNRVYQLEQKLRDTNPPDSESGVPVKS